jgi:hypothetical protein
MIWWWLGQPGLVVEISAVLEKLKFAGAQPLVLACVPVLLLTILATI